ncbi:hypothetical protein MNBD_GAMMA05-683 [hydrothermal vent metagenome]|uniref:Flagellar protein n=1 Tax=hydrothermal vent metagenome TaxID=652676 RepID=A0A3B0WI59_9ZZZZ
MFPLQVLSAEEKTLQSIKTDPMSGGYLLQLIFGLVVVIICIVALSWVAKRMQRLQSSSDGSLKIIDGINMSARERVVLLQAGGKQILVGVAPGRVNMLHVFDESIVDINNESMGKNADSFSEKLSAMISSSLKNNALSNNEQGER